MAENELDGPVLGVCWDGTGYGLDGTIWGGEFLLTNETSFTRAAHFRQFSLPGSEAAIREPRRTALGLLHAIFGNEVFQRHDLFPLRSFSDTELALLRQMLERRVQSPITSSVGRLFDAVASLVGMRQRVRFEGQAAMELEHSIDSARNGAYPFTLTEDTPVVVDWGPMILQVIEDLSLNATIGAISALFHNMLVEALVAVAHKVGEPRVVLTGGCFQSRYLTERAVQRLRQEGFRPYWHQRVPPNDGGIALGQVLAGARARRPQPAVAEVPAN
jgi:hydrogenase maturation protein HypF